MLNMPENSCGIIESEARMLIHDVAAAIDYLHSKRIVHRDLKPENIVLQDINQKVCISSFIKGLFWNFIMNDVLMLRC